MKRIYLIFITALSIALLLQGCSNNLQQALDAKDRGNFATAVKIWVPLAKEGNAVAQNNLALSYWNGEGVPQDLRTAEKWYFLAAEQGHGEAQHNVANLYSLSGRKVYGHMWANLASLQGIKRSERLREQIAKKMTRSQIKKAQDLARQCVKKNYKDC